MSVEAKKGMTIHINGTTYQPLKKVLAKDQLLGLAGLDPKRDQIFLVDNEGSEHQIDGDEGLELQNGMEFRVRNGQ
jgi:hypothetical protein